MSKSGCGGCAAAICPQDSNELPTNNYFETYLPGVGVLFYTALIHFVTGLRLGY